MYTLLEDGRFQIKNYQDASPFASFLPGISGTDGVPLWAFYVNRGQGLASFGVENKSNAMLEFLPADKAYQLTPTQGFRTFLKGNRGEETFQYEAFKEESEYITDSMHIADNYFELSHENIEIGLKLDVLYYILPHEGIPGLVREITITNTKEGRLEIEALDGLTSYFPPHIDDGMFKKMSNTTKSWFDTQIVNDQFAYYFLRGSTSDDAKVDQDDQGNFYVSLLEKAETAEIKQPIFDRAHVFGKDLSLNKARVFNGKEEIQNPKQIGTNKVSCAFTPFSTELETNESIKLTSLFGQVASREDAQDFITQKFTNQNLSEYKAAAKELAKGLTKRVETKTADPLFDAYIKQNYLDNGLRGGFPIVFENEDASEVFYIYSRKHGDLERDYNFFSTTPEYYSQGNGNYRDMNQNRRLDIFVDPRVEDRAIRQFMSLIQLDGYNPLAIKTVKYRLNGEFPFADYGLDEDFVTGEFTPGSVKKYVEDNEIELPVPFEAFLTDLLSASTESLEAEFAEGFWSDHWTYNLDLIDSYLAIYPDKVEYLYGEKGYRFFDSPAYVRPLKEKLSVSDGKVRQYNAIEVDEEKVWRQASGQDLWVTVDGHSYETNLFSKLVLLAGNKLATLAPYGIGIEMEAGRPGWNDAMNGLPGMFGAGTSELYELRRLITQLMDVPKIAKVELPRVSVEFLEELVDALKDIVVLELAEWKELTQIREVYRLKIKGEAIEEVQSLNDVEELLEVFDRIIDIAIRNLESLDTELVPTYMYFEAEVEDKVITQMTPHPVTPFLESIVKKMKVTEDVKELRDVYQKVKASGLYDKKLGMYKTSASIEEEPIELGRTKFFTRGWLENESVFLHMAYKYLLVILKSGLYEEYFEEIKTGLVVFTDPEVYGRSILENSSFIASSANPDESLHGKGFVARLSGSTVELLNMWVELFIGSNPFTVEEDELSFELKPILPASFFKDDKVEFTLFGSIQVTYLNETGKDTFGVDAVTPKSYELHYSKGEKVVIEKSSLKGKDALAIRNKEVKEIIVTLE